MLILGVERDAALAELARQAADDHLAVLHQAGVGRRADPVPPRRVAGVRVRRNAFERRLGIEVAIAAEEPQAVFLDRTAVRDATVVRLDNARRLRETDGAEIIVQVVPARPLTGLVDECGAAQRGSTRLRPGARPRATDVALSEPAADGDHDFL